MVLGKKIIVATLLNFSNKNVRSFETDLRAHNISNNVSCVKYCENGSFGWSRVESVITIWRREMFFAVV
jgi:hypothetical protein